MILQSHFVCWALSIYVMCFETDSESLSKIMDIRMSYRYMDISTDSVRWGRIHACTYAHISLHESQSELCLLLSDESGCHLRFTVMSLTLIVSLDSHLGEYVPEGMRVNTAVFLKWEVAKEFLLSRTNPQSLASYKKLHMQWLPFCTERVTAT